MTQLRPVTLGLALAFLIVVGVPARRMAGFYTHLDALADDVARGDLQGAKGELEQVTSFYDVSRAWGFQWFADAYLFRDAYLHRAAAAYLTGDYETVAADLKGRVDDARASHLAGCARFRLAEREYRQLPGSDRASTERKDAIVREVLEQINPDFERALRADTADRFAYKWNYDLTSDAEAVRRAFSPAFPAGKPTAAIPQPDERGRIEALKQAVPPPPPPPIRQQDQQDVKTPERRRRG